MRREQSRKKRTNSTARQRQKRQTQAQTQAQKGGGSLFIPPSLTPSITDSTSMKANMDFFIISAHGQTSIKNYFMVPPKTFIYFTGDSGEMAYASWSGQRKWIAPSEEDWESIYKVLYGMEHGGDKRELDALVKHLRSKTDRQIYFPGDLLPDSLCFFKNSFNTVLPMGVFRLPIQDPLILDMWGHDTARERFLPAWGILQLQKKDILSDDRIKEAGYKDEDSKFLWPIAVVSEHPEMLKEVLTKPITALFRNPQLLVDEYDKVFLSKEENLIRERIEDPSQSLSLHSILQTIPAAEGKSYRFFLATQCRTTYDFEYADPRNSYRKPSALAARRFSIAADTQRCATPTSPVLNLLPVFRAWQDLRKEEKEKAKETPTLRPPFTRIPIYLAHIAEGNPISVETLSRMLNISSLPIQDDLVEGSPAHTLLQTFSNVFQSLRRSLRGLSTPSLEVSTGERLKALALVKEPTLSENAQTLATAAAAAEKEEDELLHAEKMADLMRYTSTLERAAVTYQRMIGQMQEEDINWKKQRELDDLDAQFRQDLVNISAIVTEMGPEYEAEIVELFEAVNTLQYEYGILSEMNKDYLYKTDIEKEFTSLQQFKKKIERDVVRIEKMSVDVRKEAYKESIAEIQAKEGEIHGELERAPAERKRSYELLEREFVESLIPLLRKLQGLHDRLHFFNLLSELRLQSHVFLQSMRGPSFLRAAVPSMLKTAEDLQKKATILLHPIKLNAPYLSPEEKGEFYGEIMALLQHVDQSVKRIRAIGGRRTMRLRPAVRGKQRKN